MAALGQVVLAASRRLRGCPVAGDTELLEGHCGVLFERVRSDGDPARRQPRQSGFYPPVPKGPRAGLQVAPVSAIFEREIEARVCELVDLLVRPAGEFTPRARVVLT